MEECLCNQPVEKHRNRTENQADLGSTVVWLTATWPLGQTRPASAPQGAGNFLRARNGGARTPLILAPLLTGVAQPNFSNV